MGVTTPKKIIPIITGEIILPKKKPNLNQSILNGVKIGEFVSPKIKIKNENIKNKKLICPLLKKIKTKTKKKNIENTIPNSLFVLLLTFFIN